MPQSLIDSFALEPSLIECNEGDQVFHLGQKAESIFRVLHGHVQLFRDDLSGNRTILHQAFNGQFFAEASLNADAYHCTALCCEASTIQVFNSKKFKQLLQQNAQFSLSWIEYLSRELRRQRSHAERLSLKTVAEKITHFIMTEGNGKGGVTLPGSLTQLAQILGISREALYRTLSKMKKQRQIKQRDNSLKVL